MAGIILIAMLAALSVAAAILKQPHKPLGRLYHRRSQQRLRRRARLERLREYAARLANADRQRDPRSPFAVAVTSACPPHLLTARERRGNVRFQDKETQEHRDRQRHADARDPPATNDSSRRSKGRASMAIASSTTCSLRLASSGVARSGTP